MSTLRSSGEILVAAKTESMRPSGIPVRPTPKSPNTNRRRSMPVDLLIGERTNLLPIDDDSPDQLIILKHRNTNYGSGTAQRRRHAGVWLRSAISAIGYLLCPQDAGNHTGRFRSKGAPLFLELHQRGRGTDPSRPMEVVAVVTKDRAELGLADSYRILEQGLEHRLQFTRRRADNLQHLGACRLLLQRFTQFIKQPGVLDSDDGLGCKILHQFDLLVSEGSNLLTVDAEAADQFVLL